MALRWSRPCSSYLQCQSWPRGNTNDACWETSMNIERMSEENLQEGKIWSISSMALRWLRSCSSYPQCQSWPRGNTNNACWYNDEGTSLMVHVRDRHGSDSSDMIPFHHIKDDFSSIPLHLQYLTRHCWSHILLITGQGCCRGAVRGARHCIEGLKRAKVDLCSYYVSTWCPNSGSD